MISDHYPAGMSECDRRGLAGQCGPDCPVLEDGECLVEEEFIESWVAVCHDDTGCEGFLACRFWIEPVMKES